MFAFTYIYAIYGVLLFKNKFEQRLQDNAIDAQMNSLGSAFVIVIQLMLGDMISEIVTAGILSTNWIACFIFNLCIYSLFINVTINYRCYYRYFSSISRSKKFK